VTELTRAINYRRQTFTFCGEGGRKISNPVKAGSGHGYFTQKDKQPQIRYALFYLLVTKIIEDVNISVFRLASQMHLIKRQQLSACINGITVYTVNAS